MKVTGLLFTLLCLIGSVVIRSEPTTFGVASTRTGRFHSVDDDSQQVRVGLLAKVRKVAGLSKLLASLQAKTAMYDLSPSQDTKRSKENRVKDLVDIFALGTLMDGLGTWSQMIQGDRR